MQAYSFGEFNQTLGNRIWRFGKKEKDTLVGWCSVLEVKSRLGRFFYIPGGPVIENWERDFEPLLTVLKELGKSEKSSFVRLDPRIWPVENNSLKESPVYTQPQCTLTLDLTKSLEEIRKGLSSSTRYNIGWVGRQGVEVRNGEKNEIEIFLKLLLETSQRHNFSLVKNINYYKEQYLKFNEKGQARLYLAYYKGEVLASSVVIYYGGTATYLHAASSGKEPKLRAPYLMQWQIIEEAKKEGLKTYDFWGVASNDSPTDPWAGVTEFKKGFGGERVYYQKPKDLILDTKSHLLNSLVERTRKITRVWL